MGGTDTITQQIKQRKTANSVFSSNSDFPISVYCCSSKFRYKTILIAALTWKIDIAVPYFHSLYLDWMLLTASGLWLNCSKSGKLQDNYTNSQQVLGGKWRNCSHVKAKKRLPDRNFNL